MSQTIEQTDAAIRETFYSMEEGIDYVLNHFWFAELNRLRKENGQMLVKQKQDYKFSRRGDKLFLNDSFVFDFLGDNDLAFAFAFPFPFPFSFALTFALALQHNGFEKLNKDTCAGKVVEIDGKKYKLIEV